MKSTTEYFSRLLKQLMKSTIEISTLSKVQLFLTLHIFTQDNTAIFAKECNVSTTPIFHPETTSTQNILAYIY